ncbi:AraC family transcriptional regulator [Rhizobium sp. YTUHZ045]|uniref:helix-turn-helix transcriptional regulator n=1 Tax=unclassified Rhizobium TaxID=2613769 RepID=UPI003D334806
MKAVTFSIPTTAMTTGDVSECLSAEKTDNSFRPVGKDSVGDFSFSAQALGEFVGWTGSSSVHRSLRVGLEIDDYLFFADHGDGHAIATGSAKFDVGRSQGLLTSADRYSGVEIGEGSIAEGFSVPKHLVHKALADSFECFVPADFEFSPSLDLATGPALQLMNLMRFFRTEICGSQLVVSPIALAGFQEMFCSLITQNIQHSLSQKLASARTCYITPAQLKRAMEFAKANAALPITIADMAMAAGVSARTLQVNFRRFLNTTPMSFLRQLRFEGARRDLVQAAPSATVSEIARQWGFIHMGRFSAEYRSHFGVSPTADLARRG